MTSFLKKRFFNQKSNSRMHEKVYSKEDYEDTFVISKRILSLVGLRMSHNISEARTKYWSMFYWFEIMNVMIGGPSELVCMIMTAVNAKTFRDAIELFRMMPCFGCSVLSLFKSMKIKCNRGVFENLYNELRDMWPQGEISDDEHRIMSAALKEFNFIVKGYYWCNNVLLVTFLSPPYFIYLYRYLGFDASFYLPFEFWLPFDPLQPYIYEFILVLQTWDATVVIHFNIAWDILFCTYLAHITVQIDLLARRVRRLIYVPVDHQLIDSYPLAATSREFDQNEKEVLNSYNDRDWELRHQRELIDIVKRHHALIRLAGDVESMFSFALLINFMNSSIIICFCGFCCVLIEKWNEVAYKFFLMTALSQTWLLCWYGQKLLDSSNNFAEALYQSGWYNGSKRIKSAVLIMLQRAQTSIHVTTYGFSTISLASYSTIIKTAWSYFTLLLNFYTTTTDGADI
ncbi:odorant receptor 4-like [Anticarsia gemmatalis]|uniref:odorant receptor 4-like n=1 Tax=Anticarsia gemmatalis TaxID=129554 RepID=UPI003F75CABD